MSDMNTSDASVIALETGMPAAEPQPEPAAKPAKPATARKLPSAKASAILAKPMTAAEIAKAEAILAERKARRVDEIAADLAAAEALRAAKKAQGMTRGLGVTAVAKDLLMASPWLDGDALAVAVNAKLKLAKPTTRSTTQTIKTDLRHSLRALERAGCLTASGKAMIVRLAPGHTKADDAKYAKAAKAA